MPPKHLTQAALWALPVMLAALGAALVFTSHKPEQLNITAPAAVSVPPSAIPAVHAAYMDHTPPVHIFIKSLWINAAVDQIGLAKDGTVETPSYARSKNAAWYKGSAAPGEAGTAVILGHVDDEKERAVFFELRRIHPGAQIEITRADRAKVVFKVDSVEQVPKTQFPTAKVYAPTDAPSLRLVTCGGRFDAKTKNYLDNIIVYATLA